MTEPRARPRRRRWGCWCCSCLVVVAVVPAIAYVVAWNASTARLSAELARLKQAGEPLKLSELVPKVGAGEDNAATVYEWAFNLQSTDFGNYTGDAAKWTSAQAAAAHKLVADHGEYFAALAEASRLPKCAFEKDWDAGPNLMLPELAQFREAARALEVKAEIERTSGRLDDAAASCLTSLRIADHAQQPPMLISYLVSIAVQGISLDELEKVLSSGDPSPAACRALYDELGKRARLDPFVAALKGERAVQLATFEAVERQGTLQGMFQGGGANRLLDLYPVLGKPLWNQDEIYTLRAAQQRIEAAEKPYAEAAKETQAAEQAVDLLPAYSSIMTRMISPSLDRALWSGYRSMADAGAAQIAVAAKAFKRTRGRYPSSLDELARAGWRLPPDPFTGKPYHYAPEARGLAIWSVGPDQVDNKGLDWDPQIHQGPDAAGYDYAFRLRR